jgi:hypothetical protein
MFAACAFATIAFAQYAAVLFLPSGESSTGSSRFRERYRGRTSA